MQGGNVIAYTSSKFNPAERNYSTGEQELLGVIKAMQEWRCSVEGADAVLVADHCPLTFLQTQPILSCRQLEARWMEYLSSFHSTWEYRPGRNNVADHISRNPNLACANLYLCAIGKATSSQMRCKQRRKRRSRRCVGWQDLMYITRTACDTSVCI